MAHDLSGQPFCTGDVVVCAMPGEQDKLCFGVVSGVNYSTGAVVVQTIVISRVQVVQEHRFLFPTNQLKILSLDIIPHTHPEHEIIKELHERYK